MTSPLHSSAGTQHPEVSSWSKHEKTSSSWHNNPSASPLSSSSSSSCLHTFCTTTTTWLSLKRHKTGEGKDRCRDRAETIEIGMSIERQVIWPERDNGTIPSSSSLLYIHPSWFRYLRYSTLVLHYFLSKDPPSQRQYFLTVANANKKNFEHWLTGHSTALLCALRKHFSIELVFHRTFVLWNLRNVTSALLTPTTKNIKVTFIS